MFCRADLPFIRLSKLLWSFPWLQACRQMQTRVLYILLAYMLPWNRISTWIGHNEGTLHFRYLGVPLASRKLSILQCWPLVKKNTAGINYWTSKLLSYLGTLQLIKSVIFGVQCYWDHIFLLPKKVLKMIEATCRSILCTDKSTISKKALVSWEKICMPQVAGGLNVLNLYHWNKAGVAKHLWANTKKKIVFGSDVFIPTA